MMLCCTHVPARIPSRLTSGSRVTGLDRKRTCLSQAARTAQNNRSGSVTIRAINMPLDRPISREKPVTNTETMRAARLAFLKNSTMPYNNSK